MMTWTLPGCFHEWCYQRSSSERLASIRYDGQVRIAHMIFSRGFAGLERAPAALPGRTG
jgi:hypothetical protein